MPIERGAIYRTSVTLTDAATGRPREMIKYLVLIQDPAAMDANATNISYAVISRDQTGAAGPRSHEVQLDETDGMEVPSIVDGRWIYTRPRSEFYEVFYVWTLTDQRMDEISVAIVEGLQL